MKNVEIKKPELLVPAGSLDKMKIALEFGADAVYFGLPDFSLRARINKFNQEEIEQGAKICRQMGKKFYLTLNIYAHNRQMKLLPKHLGLINEVKPDGLIVSDPGVIRMARKHCPQIPLHLSTQANTTNIEAARFWKEQSIERIILARELSLKEIAEIRKAVLGIELEIFVHGAMCMSYSGRCILSKWMTGRSANLGDCAQPCRWKYLQPRDKNGELRVVDDKNRFELDIQEDKHGTHFFNSFDLNLIGQVGQLMEAGLDCLKIEGRSKSIYYVGIVTRAYRKVIDAWAEYFNGSMKKTELEQLIAAQKKELNKLNSRGYWTGFLLGDEPPHLFSGDSKKSEWMFCGLSYEGVCSKSRRILIHNRLSPKDQVEIITPCGVHEARVVDIFQANGEHLKIAHGGQDKIFNVIFDREIDGIFLMRKK